MSTNIVHVTRFFAVFISCSIFSPDSPEYCKFIIIIFLHVLFLGTFRISKLYSSPGYVSIYLQVLYSLFLQHSSIAPLNIFYSYYRLCIHFVPNMVIFLPIIYVYIFSDCVTPLFPTYSIIP